MSAPALPSEIPTGIFRGTAYIVGPDTGDDVDTKPDLSYPTGTITFVPSVQTAVKLPISKHLYGIRTFTLDVTEDMLGTFQIELPATDIPTSNPVDWTWQATFALSGITIPVQIFRLPSGTIAELADIVQVAASAGISIVQGAPGKSAYQSWLDAGHIGTEDDYVEWQQSTGGGTGTVTTVNGVAPTAGNVVLTKANISGLTNVDNTSDAQKVANAGPIKTALDAKADLVGGVLRSDQIPEIALTKFLGTPGTGVASQAAMLALVGQPGDWTVRSDLGQTWVITGTPTTSLSSWTPLTTPAATKASLGLGNVENYSSTDLPLSAAAIAALALKATVASVALKADATDVTAGLAPKLQDGDGVSRLFYMRSVSDPTPPVSAGALYIQTPIP